MAIIDLQSVVGKIETREQAERGWDGMQEWERQSTMDAHRVMFSEKYPKGSRA